jgi:coatomer subunit beta'
MKFDLALELGRLEIAESVSVDVSMWRRLARSALVAGEFDAAVKATRKCRDFANLLLMFKAKGLIDEMKELVGEAETGRDLNVAFSAALLTGQMEKCVELLIRSEKYAEATLFARSKAPQLVSECVKKWKGSLQNQKIAESLADPEEYPNLFDELLENGEE